MNTPLGPESFMRKSEAALAGADLLLKAGDTDGSCSRAYYAMYDAAHAALFATGNEELSAPIKTHNGLIAKFGQHLVLSGRVEAKHGEALNAVQRLRQMADYTGDPVSTSDARWALSKAEDFVKTIRDRFFGH